MSLNVLLKLSNAIDFLSKDSELLAGSAESGIIPDEDTLGLIATKVKEINEHWNDFVVSCGRKSDLGVIPDESDIAAMRILQETDKLSKTLSYKKETFVPIIYKHEWDSNSKAYWALYASRTSMGFSRKRVLMAISGTSLVNVLYKFCKFYDECSVNKYIQGKDWFGPKPFAIDFDNDKCTTGVTSDTQM